MKYIIMADGKGKRWNNYKNHEKHLCTINGETIIERTIRLLKENNVDEIIITSHNEKYDFPNAIRYEPQNNKSEIDRFTYELLENDVVFLYGDTYYDEITIKNIVNYQTKDYIFFGNSKDIVGIKIKDCKIIKNAIDNMKKNNVDGNGWTLYEYLNNINFGTKKITNNFFYVGEKNIDVDTPNEYIFLKKAIAKKKVKINETIY